MWVATFELHSMYTDTLLMLGFPVGAANDAARLVVWSDRHGFGGVTYFAAALERLKSRPFTSPQVLGECATAIELDASGGSVLEVGVVALDMAALGNYSQVTLLNLEDLTFCKGLGQVALERGLSVEVSWREDGQQALLSVCAAKQTLDLSFFASDQQGVGRSMVIVPVKHRREARHRRSISDAVVYSSALLAQREKQTLLDGVDVDDVAWRSVVDLGRMILIPESTASRLGGAGVGADED